jgi:hypothetical protein
MPALIVNFLAGPGAAKSTMAAHTFAELKWLGIKCELATEYAKEKVWEGSTNVLNDQRLVYGEQYHRVWSPAQKVDVVITDSPVILSAIYSKPDDILLRSLIIEDFKKFKNLNFFISRKKEYVNEGRLQNEEQAREKDMEIKKILVDNNIEFIEIPGVRASVNNVVQVILGLIGKR